MALTGTFYSENWIMNHLRPIVTSEQCSQIWMVCCFPIPPLAKVKVVPPPQWLISIIGEVPARLLTFALLCCWRRPHVIGGFHLLINGLLSAALARFLGSESLYFCGGGPQEVLHGGLLAETRLFGLLKAPDPWLERQLIKAVDQCDLVVTMGKRTIDFFEARGVRTNFAVIPGGINPSAWMGTGEPRKFDLIFVGRLAPVKRVDLFLQSVAVLAKDMSELTVVVVGTGELETTLKTLAIELGIQNRVTFAGYQRDVAAWFRQSRVFVLTSDSEGLSLALMEAMMFGLPCVVSDVGELGELVEDGVNGCLVADRTAQAFASRLRSILQDDQQQELMSHRAREAAMRLDVAAAAKKWDAALSSIGQSRKLSNSIMRSRDRHGDEDQIASETV